MKKILLIAALGLLAYTSYAQDRRPDPEEVKSAMTNFINQELQLSETEKEVFWPAYDKYREEMESLREGRKKPRMDLMSDAEAEAFIDNHFMVEEKKLALRKEMYQSLRTKMNVRKLAALPQAEQKFKRHLLNRVKQKHKQKFRGEGQRFRR